MRILNTQRKLKLHIMRIKSALFYLLCILCFNVSAQIDSMEVNGEFYKVYPYPERPNINDDYWLAIKDKAYFQDPENYFLLFGEGQYFSRDMFDSAGSVELTMLNKRLKRNWKRYRTRRRYRGTGFKFVKQVRRNPQALIAPKYLVNKEVIPPFSAIPDGKYVQLFSEFCWTDKKGNCQPQTNRIAGYFNIKNNSLEGEAVWLNIMGDTLKMGSFKNGIKDGEWTIKKVDSPPRSLDRWDTRQFRKTGIFDDIDTSIIVINYINGIRNGNYSLYKSRNNKIITGAYLNGKFSGTWQTTENSILTEKRTYADKDNAVLSHNPILRTDEFLPGNYARKWDEIPKLTRPDIPTSYYKIGFEEELHVELEEESFQSHELEYYGRYNKSNLPERFEDLRNFYNVIDFYNFQTDPSTQKTETRGFFIDSIGAKMLYDGAYEIYYPNGQLYVKMLFSDGALVDEGTIYWDNGIACDVIEFVADSNHYLRKAYDYKGVLFKTAIYDSLGDFVKFDEPAYKRPTLEIDGVTAIYEEYKGRYKKDFYDYLHGDFAYYNWEALEDEFTDQPVTLYKAWSGLDSTANRELKYDPVTRKMTDYETSYTGVTYWTAEKTFTADYSGWTGKSTWHYGDFTVVRTASAILMDFENDTMPQLHLRYYFGDYDVTEDIEVFLNGKPYTGEVKIKKFANHYKQSKNKLILQSSHNSGKKKIQKKLYKYMKSGRGKDDIDLALVSSISDCESVNGQLKKYLYNVTLQGYFNSVGASENGYFERKNYIRGTVYKIEGQMTEGKPQGAWTGENKKGQLMSEIAFDRGEPMGEHSRYAVHTKASKYRREMSEDSLPKRKQYYLYSTINYDKGMLNGPYAEYSWYGRIKERGSYLDDELDGEYFSRYSIAYSKSNYKNGRLDGYVKTYLTLPRQDTILLYDLNFQHGMLNGKSVAYHTNGRVAKQGFFLDGESIDDYEAFDTLGFKYHYVKFKYSHPVEEKIWEENELSLRYTFNWEDSIEFDPSDITKSMSLESLMYKMGYNRGDLQNEYYGRPRLINKTGLEYHMTKFYPNDTIARDGKIDDGKKMGYWSFFNYEGEFLYEVDYFDSIITVNDSIIFKSKGILTDYDSEGNQLYKAYIIEKMEKYDCAHTDHYEIRQLYTFWEASSDVNRMNGYVQNFYDNGVLQNEGKMKNGLPDGLWKYYDPFGKLNLMGVFHQGKRHGRWLSGDLAAKKYLGEICLNPNLPNLEKEKHYRENLLDITIINYYLGKARNRQYYDLNLNKYSNLKTD